MVTEAQGADSLPPVVPATGELVVINEPLFSAECLLFLESKDVAKNWKLGKPLLTRTDRWGAVWRVDFEIGADHVLALTNRIVCWRNSSGELQLLIAIGQKVSPLHGK